MLAVRALWNPLPPPTSNIWRNIWVFIDNYCSYASQSSQPASDSKHDVHQQRLPIETPTKPSHKWDACIRTFLQRAQLCPRNQTTVPYNHAYAMRCPDTCSRRARCVMASGYIEYLVEISGKPPSNLGRVQPYAQYMCKYVYHVYFSDAQFVEPISVDSPLQSSTLVQQGQRTGGVVSATFHDDSWNAGNVEEGRVWCRRVAGMGRVGTDMCDDNAPVYLHTGDHGN